MSLKYTAVLRSVTVIQNYQIPSKAELEEPIILWTPTQRPAYTKCGYSCIIYICECDLAKVYSENECIACLQFYINIRIDILKI